MRFIKTPSATSFAYIIKAITILLVLFFVFMLFRISSQGRDIAQRANQIATQNHQIAVDNQKHIDCVADLFARHTRVNKPITIKDLETCRASFGAVSSNATSPSLLPEPTNKKTNNSSQHNTTQHSKQSSAPEQKPPKKMLGVPVCLPFTGVCVR